MKQLIIMAIVGFSISHVQSMEVWGETRNPEKEILFNGDKQLNYSSLSNPFINVLNDYKNDESKTSYRDQMKCLPAELKRRIMSDCARIYFAKKHNKAHLVSDPLLMLHLLGRAEDMCPLHLGNKVLGWKDVVVCTKEEQENLSKICNQDPHYSFCVGANNKLFCKHFCLEAYRCSPEKSYFEMLKNMPESIKKDLVVDLTDDKMCCLWGSLIAPGLVMISSVMYLVNGASLLNGTGFFIAGGCGIGAFTCERIRQKYYSKKYYVDKNVVEQ